MQIPLRFTVNSLCAMEDLAGGALEDVFDRQFTAARLLLWGGMIDGAPGTTLKYAGDVIDRHIQAGGTLEEIVEGCAEAMKRAGLFGGAAEKGAPFASGLKESSKRRRRRDFPMRRG